VNQSKRRPFRPSWGQCIPAIFLLPVFVVLLLPSAALGQPQSMRAAFPDHGIALLEGVVIAPQLGLAYLMRPSGGIDAVDLARGTVRWHSDSGAKPLALSGNRLIAQAESRGAGTLELVALDTRNGSARDAVRVSLPAGIMATVVDTPAGSFRIRADSADSELVVRWEATGMTVAQGYLPAADDGLAPSVAAGQAVLDLASPSLRVKAEPAVDIVHSDSLARAALQEVRTPIVAGEGRQMLSADGRHVLVTEPLAAAELTLDRHRWTLYERAGGARLGSVPAMVSATPFLIVGSVLYHTAPAYAVRRDGKFVEQQAALRAVNLKTGAEMWKVTARETAFKGPFPP